MEIILKEDYPSLGYVGERLSVRRGFARNFLIPNGIAIEASSRRARMLKHHLDAIAAKRAKKKQEAQEYASRLSEVRLEFVLKSSEQGRAFGSLTARDIEARLKEQGFFLDRKQIKLGEPIRKAGTHTVEVKLHSEVTVPLKIIVEVDAQEARGKKKSEAGSRKNKGRTDLVEEAGEAEEDPGQEEADSAVAEAAPKKEQ